MKGLLISICVLITCMVRAQNNVQLFSGNGAPFKVIQNGREVGGNPQTHFSLEGINEDTLQLKVEFGSHRYGITLYLLDKGKKTSGKEFTFRVEPAGRQARLQFMGMRETGKKVAPLVPEKPRKK